MCVCVCVRVHISRTTPDLLFLLKAKRLSAGLRLQRQKYDAHFQPLTKKQQNIVRSAPPPPSHTLEQIQCETEV